MKKKSKKNGFAMIEILIAVVTVITVFSVLYNSVYPLIGAYSASQKYDDLDSKYVAFYIKEMVETDNRYRLGSESFDGCNGTCKIFRTYAYTTDSEGIEHVQRDVESINDHYLYKNELCNRLTEASNQKNNQYFCNKYITGARITKIYLTNYSLANFKSAVKDLSGNDFPRDFKSYVSYIPSYIYARTDLKNNYDRIIVEIEHDSYNTVGELYYTYASIGVKK